MAESIWGVVKGGVVVPITPLKEGAWVELRVCEKRVEFTPEEQAEFDAWNRLSSRALEVVERLSQESEVSPFSPPLSE